MAKEKGRHDIQHNDTTKRRIFHISNYSQMEGSSKMVKEANFGR
jgi:hypothetical protein